MGFPMFKVENVEVPSVLIGINPFLGYSHFSEAKSNYFKRIFKDVKAISDVIVKATELGVNGIYTPADKKIADALEQVEQRTGIEMTVVGTTYYTFDLKKIEEEIALLKSMGARICLLHGNAVDDLLNPVMRAINHAEEMLRLIRKKGLIPGIACHDARAILYSDERGYDAQVYATPVNKIGFWMNPEGLTLKIIRQTDKPVIALKPLASGRIPPEEGLEFTLSTPGVTAVAIGVANYEELTQDFKLAHKILRKRLTLTGDT
jgi:hypothetical protein